jgi:L-asparagine transporter-like permease
MPERYGALGERLMHRPAAAAFATYAEIYLGPEVGLATDWC